MAKHKKQVRNPVQRRSIEKRGRIIRTAQRLFSKHGIHGTTSNEIAAKSGVSIGTFYSYFRNKKELMMEVLRSYLAEFTANIFKGKDIARIAGRKPEIRRLIRELIASAFAAFEHEPEFHRQMWALKYSDPEIRKLFDESEKKEVAYVRSLLELYAPGMKDIDAGAKIIHSAIQNAGHYVKLLDYPMKETRILEELTEMVYRYLFRQ
ncbi:MAG: TetR/AcrR family transcriptional regulator [Spirochaetes bacterium]|nr:TetR/AcrR family transcriptional regulator [Spirochaetota bacterium]